MKRIFLSLFLVVALGMASVAFSKIINCPGINSVLPYVTSVQPVPFPECYYMGNSTKKTIHNYCKQIKKKLENRFRKEYHKKKFKFKAWGCKYNTQNKQKYYFYFAPFN